MAGRQKGSLLSTELIEVLERLSIVLPDLTHDRRGGSGAPVVRPEGIDFHEYTAYQPGLDVRQVDWSVFGRTGRLVARAYETRRDLPLCVLLDCSGSMGLGEPTKFDLAVGLAASLAYVGLVGYHPVRVLAFSKGGVQTLPYRVGRSCVHELQTFLQKLEPRGPTDLVTGVTAALEGTSRSAGRLFILSDFLDPDGLSAAFGLLATTRRRVDLIALTDPGEAALPEGEVEAVDPETGARREVLVDAEFAQAYRRAVDEHRRLLKQRTARIRAFLHWVDSRTPLTEAAAGVLAAR